MDIPVQIAVRLKPPNLEDSTQCIFSNPVTQIVITESGQTFHVNRALPLDCTQAHLYNSFMIPQINCFLDGCDTSVVVFGQPNTGKTYTLFGPGFECIHSECDQGILPRFITDIFHKLNQMPEREYVIHITWIQVVNNNIFDVLGAGLVRCYNIEEAFQYLQMGWRTRCQGNNHTVFTVSMEQKWVASNGVLNHRLSTASFCDLAAYPDPGFYALEGIIKELIAGNPPKHINYEQCLLTAMLKDSFGGRAFTWVIGCISTEPEDYQDTLKILNLCLCCRGIQNFVTVNTFADNNTSIYTEKAILPTNANDTNFNLQFATTQWIKLVSNAEGLFNKILQSKSLNEGDINQVSEWLFLKAECDECFNADIVMDNKDVIQKQGLPRIAEDTEPSEPSETDEDSLSEDEEDVVFQDKLCKYLEFFREKNDQLLAERCEEYLNNIDSDDVTISETSGSQSLPIMTSASNSGRRRTIQPGESLSGAEIQLLRKVAAKAISPESQKIILESHKKDLDPEPKLIERELLKMIDSPVSTDICKKYKVTKDKFTQKQLLARKLSKEISGSQSQLKELINLCIAKEKLISDLNRSIKVIHNKGHERVCPKSQYQKAKSEIGGLQSKLEEDKNNTKVVQHLQQCKDIVDLYEHHCNDIDVLNSGDQDVLKEVRKHETNLKAYKKQIKQLKRQIKKDEKRKNTLDIELAKDKMKLDELSDSGLDTKDRKGNNSIKHFTNRITQLDTMLKEKTNDLENMDLPKEKELTLRKEIKNLRKTRECLHDQRCSLGHKRKIYKSLSDSEERKLLECEEAIEAIDTAIEYKNNLICGKSPSASITDGHLSDGKDTRTKGEQMLMARLDKLSHEEMKTLFYKYFQKVVDLRGACVALEAAVAAAAEEADTWRTRAAAVWRHAQRMRTNNHSRQYQTVHRFLEHRPYDRALSLGITTDSDTSDDAMRLVDQLARYHPPAHPLIPTQNLRQLMPATNIPVAKVTKERNKIVIIQQNKKSS